MRDEQAAHWFAALRRGVMSLEERAEYDSWVDDPENAAALAEMSKLWTSLELVAPQFGKAATVPETSRLRKLPRAMAAAVCVVSLGVGALSIEGSGTFWTTLDWSNR